jgi:hypothetical protein
MPKTKDSKPNGYWTLERCQESALQYDYRTAWSKGDSSSYQTALRNGWMDACCGHMTRKPQDGKAKTYIPLYKECNDCGETLHLRNFYKTPQTADNRMGHCKGCHEIRNEDRLNIPAWADRKAINAIYRERDRLNALGGERYVVDHIIPCKGRLVSGFHIAENLQIITWAENAAKYNKYEAA